MRSMVGVASSHVPMLSQPHAELDAIRNAAKPVIDRY
jgi:hypothetical protein